MAQARFVDGGECRVLTRMVACLTAIGKGKTLNRKTSVSLASSLGSAILAYRKVCQKGAGRVGA
jgi:hypothetical protein